MVNLLVSSKFEVFISTHYEGMKGKVWEMGWFWVVWGYSMSLEIAPFDRAHTSSH